VESESASMDVCSGLDLDTLEIVHTQGFGFTITQGPDCSIWGTGGVPRSGAWIVNQYAPGDFSG